MEKRKVRFLLAGAALAAVLAASVSVSPALAYFTAYTSASGGVKIAVKPPDTELTEDPVGLEKTISVKNTGDGPCFVRVRLLYSDGAVRLSSASLGEGWSGPDGDEYYNYGPMLNPKDEEGDTTTNLAVTFEVVEGNQNNFHVVVAEEYTPALYDEETGGYYADWSLAVTADSIAEEKEAETE